MSIIHKDEDEGGSSQETNLVGAIICTGGIGKRLEGKHIEGLRRKVIRIQECRRIFGGHQEIIWKRR